VNHFLSLVFVSFFSIFSIKVVASPAGDFQRNSQLTKQNCVSCHQQSHEKWQQSDHAKAMAIADKSSVLANFNNIDVKHYGQKAHFFIKDGRYQVNISYDEKVSTYQVKYVFGHHPLQQYLVETQKGRLQVLPFAWDAQSKEQGGQRWYHNYSHEEIRPEDRLHWRQPLQNWNGMCADCHSDGLKRNYDSDKNQFDTTFDNINVGCLSCHGDMSKHAEHNKRNVAKDITSIKHPTGQWLRTAADKTAKWQGTKRDNSFMDNCFACHALRAPLTDGFKANTPFLEQFMPQLPTAPNYHADGQIKEEVYVYGSFLQSKMYDKGVNCLDCHDKHTMKLKIQGNGLCLQCHGAEVYNVKSHHQHQESSAGAQCVNCHMPTTRYMGVDDRRDHSFKIPRPELSVQFKTPNACTKCHDDKTNQWASNNLEKWHGKPKALSKSKQFLMALNSGQAINLEDHLSLIADTNLDVISRASALQMLSFTTQMITIEILKPYLMHQEDLMRLSAASAALLLSPEVRIKHLSPLLKDKLKAIRVAAARSLVTSKIAVEHQQAFNDAFSELMTSNELTSWRGEGRANQGLLALEQNQITKAEKAFLGAITVEPYFDTGYINLADLYRTQQRNAEVASILEKGMKNLPKSGALKYAYGLHLVRSQQHSNALGFFEQATLLEPNSSQYLYAYILSLDGQGETVKAANKLQKKIGNYSDKQQLKELGLYLAQKSQNRKMYDWFIGLK